MINEIAIVVKSIIQGGAVGCLIGTIIFSIEEWIESKIDKAKISRRLTAIENRIEELEKLDKKIKVDALEEELRHEL